MDLQKLKQMLSQRWLLDGKKDIETKFGELADSLLKHVSIQKGDKEYWMTDIEFYFYSSNHKDIITYPRNCEAGQWFFHPSGVDISFESKIDTKEKSSTQKRKPYLTDTSVFGGILIRGIKIAKVDNSVNDKTLCYNGPMLACDELFDKFDAFGNVTDFPKLVLNDHCVDIKKAESPRENILTKNKTVEQKVDSILSNNYSGTDIDKTELYACFKNFINSKYRFHI